MTQLKTHYITLLIVASTWILWGTGWKAPLINYNFNSVFLVLLTTTGLFYFFKYKDSFNPSLLLGYFAFLLLIIIFFSKGYIVNSSLDNNDSSISYLINYTIKLIILPLLIFIIPSIIRNDNHMLSLVKFMSILLIPIYLYLHYQFIYVEKLLFVGVQLDGFGKVGKNSFAGAIALSFPFFLAAFCYLERKRKILFIGLIVIFISSLYFNSRAMVILIIIQIIVFICVTHSSKLRKRLIALSIIGSLFFIFTQYEELERFILKNRYDGPLEKIEYLHPGVIVNGEEVELMEFITGITNNPYYIFDTHRGWLLYESIEGAKNSYFTGNGIATFRIRETNNGHRTENHNDLALILFEMGLLGIIFFISLFFYLIYTSYKMINSRKSFFLEASIVINVGLICFMIFTNVISSLLFWLILAINLSIIKYNKNEISNN